MGVRVYYDLIHAGRTETRSLFVMFCGQTLSARQEETRCAIMTAAGFYSLSRKHSIKLGAGTLCSVEDIALAVAERIRHSSVKSPARMNQAVVLFLERLDHVKSLVEIGVTVNGLFKAVQPLTQAAARITLSNALNNGLSN